MTKEKKQEYTLRIAHANKTELIVILYEITLTYLADATYAYEERDEIKYLDSINMAKKCIDEMIANLHFEQELAKKLKQQYIYMKKCLRDAEYDNNLEGIQTVIKQIEKLRDSYNSIKEEDKSGSVMIHTETVLIGLTYNKDKILDSLSSSCDRGYLI